VIRRGVLRAIGALAPLLVLAAAPAGMDPVNPSCPQTLDFSAYPEMRFTFREMSGLRVLLAEGRIDAGVEARLADAYAAHNPIDEIWFRSPGGDAKAGNAAGLFIRSLVVATRVPKGWACFSACNFMFMGGRARIVEPGGQFVVHMFTHLADKKAIRGELAKGGDQAIDLIGDVEQGSALLASEDNDFLIRMGVSRKLLTDVMYRQKAIAGSGEDRSTRRCLSQQEMRDYNVVNAQ